jgi:hypothetical protein
MKSLAEQAVAQAHAVLHGRAPQPEHRVPPTTPPPFGRPPGHIGGTYDWWWWNFGRDSGMPYAPTGADVENDPPAEFLAEQQRIVDGLRQLYGGTAPDWSSGIGIYNGLDNRPGEWCIQVHAVEVTPEVIETVSRVVSGTVPVYVIESGRLVAQ